MALIKCPECGKEISDKAPACIHCGYPLDSDTEALSNTNKMSEKEIDEAERISRWECKVCGFIHEGEFEPEKCPICKVSSEHFEMIDSIIKSKAEILKETDCNAEEEKNFSKNVSYTRVAYENFVEVVFDEGLAEGVVGICKEAGAEFKYHVTDGILYIQKESCIEEYFVKGKYLLNKQGFHEGKIVRRKSENPENRKIGSELSCIAKTKDTKTGKQINRQFLGYAFHHLEFFDPNDKKMLSRKGACRINRDYVAVELFKTLSLPREVNLFILYREELYSNSMVVSSELNHIKKAVDLLKIPPAPIVRKKEEEPQSKLKNCPTCGKSISNMANSCPHCGHSFTPQNQKNGLGFWGVVGAIIVAVLLLMFA